MLRVLTVEGELSEIQSFGNARVQVECEGSNVEEEEDPAEPGRVVGSLDNSKCS